MQVDAFIPEGEYVKHTDRVAEAQARRASQYLDDALGLKVPPKFHLDNLKKT